MVIVALWTLYAGYDFYILARGLQNCDVGAVAAEGVGEVLNIDLFGKWNIQFMVIVPKISLDKFPHA